MYWSGQLGKTTKIWKTSSPPLHKSTTPGQTHASSLPHLHKLEVVHVLSPRETLNVDVLVDVQAIERRLEDLTGTRTNQTSMRRRLRTDWRTRQDTIDRTP